MSHLKRTHTVLGVVLTAAVLTLTACGGANDSDTDAADESTSQESSAPDESGQEESGAGEDPQGPDLEGIPDVVAEVNGEEVTRDEFVPVYEAQFQEASSQAQMGGEQPDEESLKQETADGLVETELLRQEADSRGISATDKDVEDTLTGLAQQNQMATGDELLAALEKQGMPEELVRSQVESQVVVERLLKDETGTFKPTEAELRKIYDAAVKQQEAAGDQAGQQAIPPFAKVRPQLVQQARSDQQGKAAQALVDQLREDADITIHL